MSYVQVPVTLSFALKSLSTLSSGLTTLPDLRLTFVADDEVEIGLGIHGEPGTHREKMTTANEFTEKLFEKVYVESNAQKGDRFAVLVNGLGETTLIELFIINNHLQDLLKGKEVEVAKTLVGNYITSLDMGGFSITLLKLDKEMEELLNAEEDTIAF